MECCLRPVWLTGVPPRPCQQLCGSLASECRCGDSFLSLKEAVRASSWKDGPAGGCPAPGPPPPTQTQTKGKYVREEIVLPPKPFAAGRPGAACLLTQPAAQPATERPSLCLLSLMV